MSVAGRRGLVYFFAGGASLAVHAAVIWYGANAAVAIPFSQRGGDKIVTLQLVSEKAPIRNEHALSDVRGLDTNSQKNASEKISAEQEHLFPAFYGMHYYDAKELTQKPLVTLDIPHDFALHVPNAPENAAIFLLLINERGEIDKVVVESSYLPDSVQSTLENTFKAIKFLPGQIKGKAVKSALKIQIRLDSEATAK